MRTVEQALAMAAKYGDPVDPDEPCMVCAGQKVECAECGCSLVSHAHADTPCKCEDNPGLESCSNCYGSGFHTRHLSPDERYAEQLKEELAARDAEVRRLRGLVLSLEGKLELANLAIANMQTQEATTYTATELPQPGGSDD